MIQKRLVLIDGNAILHRAYHALPPLTTRSGQLVNAVYGFLTMLFRVVEDLKPTHLAVAFDTEKPTFRHVAYVGYQAQRPRIESDLAEQIQIVQDVIKTADIPIFMAPGYEADDIIGTLATQATKFEIIIVSGDRDLLQLVNLHVKVYAPIRGLTEARLFDAKGVREYIGIAPSKIVDFKGLVGDTSDNYPGVPGIGPKTAVSLLKEFGSFNGIYKNLKSVAPGLAEKLSEGHDSAVLSQSLAKINTDAPVEVQLHDMKFKGFDNAGFINKLRELGFKSLVSRLAGGKIKKKITDESQLKLV